MDHRRTSSSRRDTRGGDHRRSTFNRASSDRDRDRFEPRKRKNDYDYDLNSHNNSHNYTVPNGGNNNSNNGGGGRGGGYDNRDNSNNNNYHDDNNRGGGRQRRSRSPPPSQRWERGKKQQKKTQTDVPPERELFVGNIPSDVNDNFLLAFLNGAMRHAKICPRHETGPCLSAQINSGNFAFVEMLNAEYANKCLDLNGVLFLNARIKVGRPKKYTGPFVVTKTWQEITGDSLTIDAVLDSEAEKVNRELFVGNTTAEMTDQMLKDFLGTAMGQVGLSIMDGNPITVCEMFGKYAFIEMRTPRETANALNLNNIEFMNSKLQITRPAKYQGEFEEHMNWEQVLARHGIKPEEFHLGQVLNPTALLTSSTANAEPIDGENIQVVKAELAQVKRALEITRHQLEECSKKSEARKEQLISLNRKWSEGKSELNDHRSELDQVRDELKNKNSVSVVNRVTVDMDSRLEAQSLKKKHEETQGMLRGVTESLLKATEKLQNERKARKSLEHQFQEANFNLNLSPMAAARKKNTTTMNSTDGPSASTDGTTGIDFAGLRAQMSIDTDVDTKGGNSAGDGNGDREGNNSGGGGMEIDTAMEVDDDETSKMDSLKDFLAKTPKTNINWGGAKTPTESASIADGNTPLSAPRSRDRAGIRLCRLLIKTGKLAVKDAIEVQGMASKYNLGGFIQTGNYVGFIVVEGLEFNCDIFMDNFERQKPAYVNVGKVSERSGRSFPMELTVLSGESASDDFKKACECVGLKDKLESALKNGK